MAFNLVSPSRHDVYPFIDPRGALEGAASGKTVLITGAGGGIGRGIAQAFALAGAATVILAARRAAPLEETKASVTSVAPDCKVSMVDNVDISDWNSVQNLFDTLRSSSSLPDVLISNAAVSLEWNTVHKSSIDKWWQNLDINLKGTYLMAKGYLAALEAAGRNEGRIINVSSSASWRYIPGQSSYAASKAGLNILSDYINREEQWPGCKVRCVAMHPGGVVTNLGGEKSPEIMKLLIDQPALPGGTAVYLSTERANFLMGRYIPATWDMEELEKHKERIEKDDDLLKERIVGIASFQ